MERKLKVFQYGTGKMSVDTMRYVYEKGAEIVGAVDVNPAVIGKDIGEIIGSEKKGILVKDGKDAKNVLQETKPDIVIVTTMSLLNDVEEPLMLCAELGINAITTCEEAFFPMNSNPNLTKKIDELAKKNNCTIKGSSSYNVEDYGIALAKAHGAGLPLADFEKEIASADKISKEARQEIIEKGKYLPSYMWNVNGWLAEKLGLTVMSQTQKCVPQTHNQDIFSSTLNMTVKAGDATGMSAVVTTETKEGITIESECIGKVYAPEEFDKNIWTVEGEPNTTIVVEKPATVELTCATIVNRLPDVVNAEAGYVPTEKMGDLQFKLKPLNEYVK